MVAACGALFHLFVARRLIAALELTTTWPRRRLQLSIAGAAFFLILYPLVLLGGYSLGFSAVLQRFDTLVDIALTYPFWVGIVVSAQLVLVCVFSDLARLTLYPLYRKYKARWIRIQARVFVILSCLMVVYVAARAYKDTATLRVRQTEFWVAGLPRELDGLRIVQTADIQVDNRTNGSKLEGCVKTVNELRPDLILFCGDLVTSGTSYIEYAAAAMGRMKARYGTYACLGDHDHFSDRQLVVQSLTANGVEILDNAAVSVPVGSSAVGITGVTNVYRRRAIEHIMESVDKQRPPAPLSIFLTHQPSESLVNFAAARGYDLFLAGHTHGGQIALPLPGILLTGATLETKYVTGFEKVGPMLVSVSNGLGLTLAPIRYHAPAEVTMIVVRAGS